MKSTSVLVALLVVTIFCAAVMPMASMVATAESLPAPAVEDEGALAPDALPDAAADPQADASAPEAGNAVDKGDAPAAGAAAPGGEAQEAPAAPADPESVIVDVPAVLKDKEPVNPEKQEEQTEVPSEPAVDAEKPAEPTAPEADAEGAEPAAPEADAEGAEPAAPEADAEGAEPAAPEADAEGAEPAAPEADAEGTEPTVLPEDAQKVATLADALDPNRSIDIYAVYDGDYLRTGMKVTLVAVLHGYENLTYSLQWQMSAGEGGQWNNVGAPDQDSITFTLDASNYAASWRVVVNITGGTIEQ